jgi:hypothetical protein
MDERKAAREAAAKAVAEVIRDAFDRKARPVTDVSDAAIDAYEAALKAGGWVIVPRDPTPAMHRAGMDERRMQDDLNKAHGVIIDTSDVYREMIAASEAEKG